MTDAPTEPIAITCADCGAPVPAGAAACPRCGGPVAEEAIGRCPDCGAGVSPEAASCPACGAPLGNAVAASAPTGAVGTTEPRPALRWLARITDYACFSFLVGIVAGVLYPTMLDMNDYLFGFMVIVGWLPVEAWLLARRGTTPGKWLCALTVVTESGDRLHFNDAMHRSVLVFWRGLGALLPIVPLFTMARQARLLTKTGRTSWDRDLGLEVLSGRIGPMRTVGLLAVWGVILLLVMLGLEAA